VSENTRLADATSDKDYYGHVSRRASPVTEGINSGRNEGQVYGMCNTPLS
jgi:hypothetical protein